MAAVRYHAVVIRGIVLAAGASQRMGSPKPLLTAGGHSFVRRVLQTLQTAGITDSVVVVRPDAGNVRDEVIAAGYGRPVVNPDPGRGQLSSLVTGLDAVDAPGVSGVLVTLVDVPLIEPATVAALLSRASGSPAPILRATHRGRHGHPVVFKRVVFDALRGADLSRGAKPVMRAYGVENVEVDDPGVLRDFDTPEDYANLE